MQQMPLGSFSVSLAVKDIEASRRFYEKLGFTSFAGEQSNNWLILKNGDTVIGLFQGMFEKNMLTFNPGWDQSAQPLEQFTDIRELQRALKADGVALMTEADGSTTAHPGCAALLLQTAESTSSNRRRDRARLSHRKKRDRIVRERAKFPADAPTSSADHSP